MTSFSKMVRTSLVVAVSIAILGCSDSDDKESQPLQPLIYTEYPDLTPEGAAVREDRLMRQLLDGVTTGGWGRLEAPSEQTYPELIEPEILGATIVEALLQQDEERWEYIFISPQAYAELVHVGAGEAAEFVDNQMGKSMGVWELFFGTRSSEMSEGGLGALLEFESIELGRGRTVQGGIAGDDDEVAQYWGNQIVLRHRGSEITFGLNIPRIFRVIDHREGQADESDDGETGETYVLKVASEIEADSRFDTFISIGLHLRPQLLRPTEYPFPLNTGNFWRYRRYEAGHQAEAEDPLERGLEEQLAGVAADEVIMEVRQVSQYGSLRLIHLLRAYDDQSYTRTQVFWVITPRRIYLCNSTCRDRIEDLDWMLGYFHREVPILVFPLRTRDAWGRAGVASEDPVFDVEDQWHQIESPAGTFPGTLAITGAGPLARGDRYHQGAQMTRYFAPGRGVIRREVRSNESEGGPIDVIEELVEYRISN